jgi:hypothetical protein
MPYKRNGKDIYVKRNGKWELKQKCQTVGNAKRALRLLNAIERMETE